MTRRVVIPVCLVVYRVRLIDFPDHLVVNWVYSSRRRRVRLVNSPDSLVVIRLVATEFVSSTRETDSPRITPLRLVKCRVRLDELWDRLVVDQFKLCFKTADVKCVLVQTKLGSAN